MNGYLKEGYCFAEALKMSNPEKYEDLLKNAPHVIENLNKKCGR